ncbi:MAG: sporulation protein YqfD [Bacilli bacterium]|nr:sporulation protein YqfD [Bacilli bacterium]
MINHLKIQVKGEMANSFFYELVRRRIPIFFFEKRRNEILFTIHFCDYSKVQEIPTTCEVRVLKRYGICWYRYLLFQYWYFFLFVLCGVFCDFFFSHFIFQVEVIHPNQTLVSIVEKDLKELGIHRYAWKVDYESREKIKEKLLEREKDSLEWLEIEEIGTKYKITLEERKKNSEDEFCYPRHLVAKKNAILLEIDASSGEIVAKKNDYVEKGDIIVSGFIHNKEKIVSKRCATGRVYGETWYRVKVVSDSFMVEKNLSKDIQRGFFIQFFHWFFGYQTKFITFQEKEYNIIEGRIVPIRLGFVKYQRVVQREYSQEEVIQRAVEKAYQAVIQKLQEEEEILSKKVLKIETKDSKIEVEVFFKVKEDITDYFDISNVPIEELEED